MTDYEQDFSEFARAGGYRQVVGETALPPFIYLAPAAGKAELDLVVAMGWKQQTPAEVRGLIADYQLAAGRYRRWAGALALMLVCNILGIWIGLQAVLHTIHTYGPKGN